MLHPSKQVFNPAENIFVSHGLQGINQVAQKRRICRSIVDKRWNTLVVKYDPKNRKNMFTVIQFRDFLRQLNKFKNLESRKIKTLNMYFESFFLIT